MKAKYDGASCESLLALFAADDCSRAVWIEPSLSFQQDELRGALPENAPTALPMK